VFCGGVKWLRRSNLAAGRSLENPDMNDEVQLRRYELWRREVTARNHCRSPTPTMNGSTLPPSTRTQLPEQECSYLTASRRHLWKPYSRNTPKAFHEEPSHILSRGRRNMCIRLWQAPGTSTKFVGEWKFVLQCYRRDKNRTGCPPALLQLFRLIFFQRTWQALFLGG